MTETSLIISQNDYQKISSLIRNAETQTAVLLEEEIGRAMVVSRDQLPSDVVSMNSTVKFVCMDSSKESVVKLVFPQDANIEENKVSILAPVGAALIGLRVGQVIKWPLPHGKETTLKVVSVLNHNEE
jgi:regulator of nucleoside diphosphate kinase